MKFLISDLFQILKNIFAFLSITDLIKCRSVSSEWNNQIAKYHGLTVNFEDCHNNLYNLPKFNKMIKASKVIPFSCYILNFRTHTISDIGTLFKVCGSSVKELTIAMEDFTEPLSRYLPNLEYLHLDDRYPRSRPCKKIKKQKKADIDEDTIFPIVFSKLTDIKYTVTYKQIKVFCNVPFTIFC